MQDVPFPAQDTFRMLQQHIKRILKRRGQNVVFVVDSKLRVSCFFVRPSASLHLLHAFPSLTRADIKETRVFTLFLLEGFNFQKKRRRLIRNPCRQDRKCRWNFNFYLGGQNWPPSSFGHTDRLPRYFIFFRKTPLMEILLPRKYPHIKK